MCTPGFSTLRHVNTWGSLIGSCFNTDYKFYKTNVKTRMIYTIFWKKMIRMKAPKEARFLFSYLLDCEHINMSGVFLLDDMTIMNETAMSQKELEKGKKWLEDNKKVYFYDGYVKIVNALEHNGYHRTPKNQKTYQNELEEVPKHVRDCFDNKNDTSIGGVSEVGNNSRIPIINHKSKTNNQKPEIKNQGECEGGDSLMQLEVQSEPEQPVKAGGTGTYHSPEDIGELEFRRVAERYNVPESFVRSKYDDMVNWCGAKGKTYKNYYLALCNWVKKDALQVRQQHEQQQQRDNRYAVSFV